MRRSVNVYAKAWALAGLNPTSPPVGVFVCFFLSGPKQPPHVFMGVAKGRMI